MRCCSFCFSYSKMWREWNKTRRHTSTQIAVVKNSWHSAGPVPNADVTDYCVNCLFPLLPVSEVTAKLSFTVLLCGKNNLVIIVLIFQTALRHMKILFWRAESHHTSELQLPTQCCVLNVALFVGHLSSMNRIHQHVDIKTGHIY